DPGGVEEGGDGGEGLEEGEELEEEGEAAVEAAPTGTRHHGRPRDEMFLFFPREPAAGLVLWRRRLTYLALAGNKKNKLAEAVGTNGAELVAVCLQAQRVAGLPLALDGRPVEVECRLLDGGALGCAIASSAAGVADFHDRAVLLLHCGPLASSCCFTLSISAHHHTHLLGTLSLDLSDLHLHCRPSPIALRFALAHGALLTLALHDRRVALHPHPRSCCCFFHFHHHHQRALDDDGSAGFITIDKEDALSRLSPVG
ncbi:hypothetical protein E2562_001353, partial [Oryza meyeriana var. granulata]